MYVTYSDRSLEWLQGDATTNPKCENCLLYISGWALATLSLLATGVNIHQKILLCHHQVTMFFIVFLLGLEMLAKSLKTIFMKSDSK